MLDMSEGAICSYISTVHIKYPTISDYKPIVVTIKPLTPMIFSLSGCWFQTCYIVHFIYGMSSETH